MTNREEYLAGLTDEQLAEILTNGRDCCYCPAEKDCETAVAGMTTQEFDTATNGSTCYKIVLKWLKEERK